MSGVIRNIIDVSERMPSKPLVWRLAKLMEEVGEVAETICKDKPDEFIDECADAMIVLIDMVNKAVDGDAEAILMEAVNRKLIRWETKYGGVK